MLELSSTFRKRYCAIENWRVANRNANNMKRNRTDRGFSVKRSDRENSLEKIAKKKTTNTLVIKKFPREPSNWELAK
jgi:hypothetical protein